MIFCNNSHKQQIVKNERKKLDQISDKMFM